MNNDTLALVAMTPQQAMELFLAQSVKDDVPTDQLYVFKVNPGPGSQTRLDVYIKLTPGDMENWNYGGSTTFTFNRIDLTDFFSGIDIQLSPTLPTDVATVCGLISSIGQIAFDPADFIQEEITEVMALEYYLKAAPDSLRWIGQVPINLLRQTPLFQFFVKPGVGLISNMGNLESITSDYGIGIFSPLTNGVILGSQLQALKAGQHITVPTNSPAIPWALFNQVLNQSLWVINPRGSAPFNGYGATVLYNGPIDPENDRPYNTTLNLVCRIQLNPTYCSNQDGTLSIYYNLSRVGS
jgi:hypothetical protein